MKHFIILLIVTIVVAASHIVADVPTAINYQGRLLDEKGQPVADATYRIRFSIFDRAQDGELLWEESQEVEVINGLFATLLGSVELIFDNVFTRPSCYLSIMVEGDPEILPRTMLVTVPWAFRVSTIDGATGGSITSKVSIGPGHSNTGSNSFVAGSNNRVDGNEATIGGGTRNRVNGNYSTVPGGYADTIDATADYSYLFGIGSKLSQDSTFMVDMPHVWFGDETDGYEIPSSRGTAGQVMQIDGSGNVIWATVSSGSGNDNLGNHTETQNLKLNGNWLSNDGGSEGLFVDRDGDVGIGIRFPNYTLHVGGSAGKPGGGSWTNSSDRRLKQNVNDYSDGLREVLAINPVTFNYNELSGYDTQPEYVGVIAQELQKIAPYMVSSDEKEGSDYLNVDPSAMTFMLINAVKELNVKNDSKDAEIDNLKEQITELTSLVQKVLAQQKNLNNGNDKLATAEQSNR